MASTQPPVFNRSLKAAVDLSAKQFHFVGNNGSNEYNVIGDDILGDHGAGFLWNKPLAGEFCEVATIGGGAKAKISGTVSANDELIAKADGTLIEQGAGGAANTVTVIVAIALEDGVTGDIIAVQPVLESIRKHV